MLWNFTVTENWTNFSIPRSKKKSLWLNNHLQERERLRVARSESPRETVLCGWYPGRTHSPERQRRLAAEAMIEVCSPPRARRRRGIIHCAIPPLSEWRAAVMEHRIISFPDRSLRLRRRLIELRRPWAHWQLRRLPVSIWRLQCGCLLLLLLLKCFPVEC